MTLIRASQVTPQPGAALHASRSFNTATAGQDRLTLGATPYEESLQLFVGGALKRLGTDYTITGAVVSFTPALTAGQVVADHYWTTTNAPADSVLSTSGPTVYLEHTFTSADTAAGTVPNADTGQVMAASAGGTWRMLANAATDTTTTNESMLTGDSAAADGTFTCRLVAVPPSGDGGLVIRASTLAANDCLLLNVEATRYALYSRAAGAYTLLVAVAKVPAAGDVLQIVASGQNLTASVGGVSGAATYNALLGNPRVGFRSSNGGAAKTLTLDDLKVTS